LEEYGVTKGYYITAAAGAALGAATAFGISPNLAAGRDSQQVITDARRAAEHAANTYDNLVPEGSCEWGVLRGELRRYGNDNPDDDARSAVELGRSLNDCGQAETHKRLGAQAFNLIPVVYETAETAFQVQQNNGYTNNERRRIAAGGGLVGLVLSGAGCLVGRASRRKNRAGVAMPARRAPSPGEGLPTLDLDPSAVRTEVVPRPSRRPPGGNPPSWL
jgi:hypothetical protein